RGERPSGERNAPRENEDEGSATAAFERACPARAALLGRRLTGGVGCGQIPGWAVWIMTWVGGGGKRSHEGFRHWGCCRGGGRMCCPRCGRVPQRRGVRRGRRAYRCLCPALCRHRFVGRCHGRGRRQAAPRGCGRSRPVRRRV